MSTREIIVGQGHESQINEPSETHAALEAHAFTFSVLLTVQRRLFFHGAAAAPAGGRRP